MMAECLNSLPSTVAEARAFTDTFLGGTAALTKSSLPMPSLTMPPRSQLALPTPPQSQSESQETAASTVASPIVDKPAAEIPSTDAKPIVVKSEDGADKMDLDSEPFHGIGSSGIIPALQNVLCSVNVDCMLDLKTIALHSRNAEYNPKRFAAVIMRIRDPKSTALIFRTGKVVVTGNKSEADGRLAARKFTRIIVKLGFAAKFLDFKVHNVVASCDVGFPISLQRLKSHHPHFSSYEPESFPGLIYRLIHPKVVFMIFVSGKVVLTGAKTREDIYQAFEMLLPVLRDFCKARFEHSKPIEA